MCSSLTHRADLEAIARQTIALVSLFLTRLVDLEMVAHQTVAAVWPARNPNLGLVALTTTNLMCPFLTLGADLEMVAQKAAAVVWPARRPNLGLVARLATAARTVATAMCLWLWVEAEMFQQFVAVVRLSSWTSFVLMKRLLGQTLRQVV
jgi:hypothetical protein